MTKIEAHVSIAQVLIRHNLKKPTDMPTGREIGEAVKRTASLVGSNQIESIEVAAELCRRYGN